MEQNYAAWFEVLFMAVSQTVRDEFPKFNTKGLGFDQM